MTSVHPEVVSDDTRYACDECGLPLETDSLLHEHQCTHSGERPYPCPHCGKGFSFKKNLKHHIIKVHPEFIVPKNTDDQAMKKRTNSKDKSDKVMLVKNERAHQCSKCPASFSKAHSLEVHMIIHDECRIIVNGKPRYVCNICDKKFPTNADLKKHKRIHTGERPYQCQVCQKRFTQIGHLTSHMKSHSNQKDYACEICDTRFKYSCSLKKHYRIHSGAKSVFECPHCYDIFKSQAILTSHIESAHENGDCVDDKEEAIKCHCGRTFRDGSQLITHAANCDSRAQSSFTCALCGEVFASMETLTVHTQCHIKKEINSIQDRDSESVDSSVIKSSQNLNYKKISEHNHVDGVMSDTTTTAGAQHMTERDELKPESDFHVTSEAGHVYTSVNSNEEYEDEDDLLVSSPSSKASADAENDTAQPHIDLAEFPLIAQIKKEIIDF